MINTKAGTMYVISDIIVFSCSTIVISFEREFFNQETIDKFLVIYTIESIFICLKLISLVSLFGQFIPIVDAFIRVIDKALVMCKDLF